MKELNVNKLKDYVLQITMDLLDLIPSNLTKDEMEIDFDVWLDNGLIPDNILNQYFINNGIVNLDVKYIVSSIYYKIMRDMFILRNKTEEELIEEYKNYVNMFKVDKDIKCLTYIKTLSKLIENKIDNNIDNVIEKIKKEYGIEDFE